MTSTAETALPHFGDRYRVERELGRGGMATVYLCTDTKSDRKVAIKLLHQDLAAAVGSARFHREIKIASGLTHPNILPAHDSGEADGSLFYVMPFVQGESLRDRLTRERQLPVQDAVRITSEIASALQYAHAQGIVHRDIKPENILLEGEHAVLADFGIARAKTGAAEAEALTQTGMSLGTPAYMSPEQAMGEKHIDGRSDQYSLACVMYEMLAGYPPFMANTMQALIAKHLGEQVPLLTTVRPSIPDELEDVVLHALEKVPADRFQSMQEFSDALNNVISMTGTWARRTATRPTPMKATRGYRTVQPPPRSAGRKWLAIAGAIVVVSAIGAGAAWLYSRNQSSRSTTGVDYSKIAVLYFTDESRDGSLRYLADGLTESLIDQLRQIQALDVISRNGVAQYRAGTVSVRDIASALKVGSVVEGSLEQTSAGIRVDVRLDDYSGASLQRASFVYPNQKLIGLQDSVASQVVEFLRLRVGDQVRLADQDRATQSSEAWLGVQRAERRFKEADSLLQAGASVPGIAALMEADSMLARAGKDDPRWSAVPAQRALLAYTRANASRKDPSALPAIVDGGIAFADRALALNPRDADALEFKGRLQYFKYNERLLANPKDLDRVLVDAESTLTKAVAINKNQAGAWDALSDLAYRKPDLAAVTSYALRAYESDAYLRSARSILERLFYAYYNTEQFTEAMRYLNLFKSRFPNDRKYFERRILMYRTRYQTPDVDSAWAYYRQLVQAMPEAMRPLGSRKAQMLMGGVLANAQLPDSARSVLLRARSDSAQLDPGKELPINEAAVRVMLGDKDIAVDLISQYLTANPSHRRGFANGVGWYWRGLQDFPRFKALLTGLQ
ncbi:MAG TPA: protein kinase [Gemmatimonadaceae bacterium]|nr:protein kinase [Gemmatimonadaceae bacterium]